jgi:hypothetical protein
MKVPSTASHRCLVVAFLVTAALASGCVSSRAGAIVFTKAAPRAPMSISGGTDTWSARRACGSIVGSATPDFFTDLEQVHLVLTTYAKGESVESEGDIGSGMPPATPVWVVEVHARSISWNHSVPRGYTASTLTADDYSVVMNAATGRITDRGECRCWPLPLQELGTVVSLSSDC